MSTTLDSPVPAIDPEAPDPFGWLEEVEGEEALAWVRARNDEAHARLAADPDFAATEAGILEVLDSDARIPEVSRIGDLYYNFWRDAEHIRGIWRRATLESYRTAEPDWELVLDLDALAEAEGESWVWHGASMLRPAAGQPWRRALVSLSPGGSDADVTREFDLVEKSFAAPVDGAFRRPQAKGELAWLDEDRVFVATDFGPGSTTSSGYPRIAKLWRRGTPLESAVTLFEGSTDDVYIGAYRSHTPGFERDFVSRATSFYTSETWLVTGIGTDAQALIRIDVPESAEIGFHREWLVVELRDDWEVGGASFVAGSLLAIDFDAFLAGARDFTVLFAPTATTSLVGAAWTRHHVVLNVLDDVKNRPYVLTPPEPGRREWVRSEFWKTDPILTLGVAAVDPVDSDDVWVTTTGYLTPATLSLGSLASRRPVDTAPSPDRREPVAQEAQTTTRGSSERANGSGAAVVRDASMAGEGGWAGAGVVRDASMGGEGRSGSSAAAVRDASAGGDIARPEALKAAPGFFEVDGLVAEQRFTNSDDGTRVPYFVVGRPEQLSGADGPAPTLLYGYGGFEVPLLPGYSGGVGRSWLARGGVYAVANIRGGGEYGPAWHQAALLANRHKAYEDFAAVARDLVAGGITVPSKLGAQGGSNGGLLVGNMLVGHGDLFGAIVCQVPLLDMKRYSHLLAGASWMAEYGDPDDPRQWEFIRTFSPYHLFSAERVYPPVLFTTSTKDDRVHPGHARKLAALMLTAGKDVTYYENIEGGHGGAATNSQAAHMAALAWTFLWERLG